MRHGKKFNHLGRTKSHRKAMLSNMANSLIEHKRITTTVAKAKALRKFIEPIITRAKNDTTHSRRTVFATLRSKESIKALYGEIATKIGDRPGGYTRVLKLGNRLGDNAEMAMIELVDYNEAMLEAKAAKGGKSKKATRRRGGAKKTATAPVVEAAAEEVVEAPIEEVIEETIEAVKEEAPVVEEAPVADDLTKIEGIGPKIGEVLTSNGISTFALLAGSTPESIKAFLDAAEGNFAAHETTTWPAQAQMAADGKWDELKKWQDELDGGKA